MSWLIRLFHSFTRQKIEQQETPHSFTNSPKLVANIYALMAEIEEKNAKIVGSGIYSTSGHNNQSLVYRAVSFAEYRVEEIIGTCDDEDLINTIIEHINQSKKEFNEKYYDPDGAGIGTLVDIANELENIHLRSLSL